MTIFRVSDVETALERSFLIYGRKLYIYGYSAYTHTSYHKSEHLSNITLPSMRNFVEFNGLLVRITYKLVLVMLL